MRSVPTAPADVIAYAFLWQASQCVVKGFDADRREFLVLLDVGLRIGHVPAVRQSGVVELQYETGIDDRPVFMPHRLAERVQELLVRFVVLVLPAREAARGDRRDKSLLGLHLGERRFEIRNIGAYRLLALIFDRRDKDRRTAAHGAGGAKSRRVELAVEFRKSLPVPSVR